MSTETHEMSDWEAYQYARQSYLLLVLVLMTAVIYLVLAALEPEGSLNEILWTLGAGLTAGMALLEFLAIDGNERARHVVVWLHELAGGSGWEWDAFDVEVEYGDQQ